MSTNDWKLIVDDDDLMRSFIPKEQQPHFVFVRREKQQKKETKKQKKAKKGKKGKKRQKKAKVVLSFLLHSQKKKELNTLLLDKKRGRRRRL